MVAFSILWKEIRLTVCWVTGVLASRQSGRPVRWPFETVDYRLPKLSLSLIYALRIHYMPSIHTVVR